MDLLPKAVSDFSTEKYWNDFFDKRGSRAFEWYGEYWQLCGVLHKYIRLMEKVLIIGCGNSTLSADLFDGGYLDSISIDISERVISQMTAKYSKTKPSLKFQQMDVFSMAFKDEEFNVVLDKGTVDALMPDGNKATCDKIDGMFAEISRVLHLGGRFICISLLQEHVMRKLLGWFTSEWIIRVHRCFEAEDTADGDKLVLPVFAVVCTKMKKLPNFKPIFELVLSPDSKPKRVENVECIVKEVVSQQQYAFCRYMLKRKPLKTENVSLQLYTSGNDHPRYELFVVDRTVSSPLKFAIFIVPEGRETEWLFGTQEGRVHLSESCRAQRLVVVHLNRNHKYSGLDQVKSELSLRVMELSPSSSIQEKDVPFMSIGDDVGNRTVQFTGNSSLSGDFVVEDVHVDDSQISRRLIFLNNPNVIQSEIRLKTVISKKKKGKVVKMEVDELHLSCEYYKYMVAGLSFIAPKAVQEPASVLLIGLGGGSLAAFMCRNFAKLKLDVIELDPAVVEIAKKWFMLPDNPSLEVIVDDGLKFVEEAVKNGLKYDALFLDVDSKDLTIGMTCPPAQFVESSFLENVVKLVSEAGIVVMNLVCRSETVRKEVHRKLEAAFERVYSRKIEAEVNEVMYLFPKLQNLGSGGIVQNLEQLNLIMKKINQDGESNVADLLNDVKL